MYIDSRFEGRVYQCGRDLIELCVVGATIVVCEITTPDNQYMEPISIADCELQILSGTWKPATHDQIVSLATLGLQHRAAAC